MVKRSAKKQFPVSHVRDYLEPGPIVLVSSSHGGKNDIMTMGWHMMMGFEPALVGCYIWEENLSHDLIRRSKECVINIPSANMAETVVRIGNSSGAEIDKFEEFGLTPEKGRHVAAPRIAECDVNLECKLVDTSLIKKYSLFVFEVVHAVARKNPERMKTMHYRGNGSFMLSGGTKNLKRLFRPDYL